LLEKTPKEVNSFLSNPAQYAASMKKAGDAQARELLDHVCECLEKECCETFDDCITWARLKYDLSPHFVHSLATFICLFWSALNNLFYLRAWLILLSIIEENRTRDGTHFRCCLITPLLLSPDLKVTSPIV